MATAFPGRRGQAARTAARAAIERSCAAALAGSRAVALLPALSQVGGLEDLMYQPADFASRALPQRGFDERLETIVENNCL